MCPYWAGLELEVLQHEDAGNSRSYDSAGSITSSKRQIQIATV